MLGWRPVGVACAVSVACAVAVARAVGGMQANSLFAKIDVIYWFAARGRRDEGILKEIFFCKN